MLSTWNIGMLEYWNHCIFQCDATRKPNISVFQHSIIPIVSEAT
jgi:hypothetical protein